MKTYSVIKKLGLAAVAGLFLALNASATVNYVFDPNGVDDLTSALVPSKATTFTQVFTVTPDDAVNISALGVYGFEIINNVTVAIYDSTALGVISGSALDTATFVHAQQVSSDYTYSSTSLHLTAGTYAIVTSYTGGFGTSGYYAGSSGDITAWAGGDGVTLGNLYRKSGSGSPSLQDDTALGSGSMAFSLTAVPEVSLFGVAGVALLGLVYVGRAYSQKLKMA